MTGRIRRRKTKSRRRVLVNMKSGESFDGAIWTWADGVVELKGAIHIVPGGNASGPYDGTVVLFEADIDWIQDPKGD